MRVVLVGIKHPKSVVRLFSKLDPIGPCSGLSNDMQYILVGKGDGKLTEFKVGCLKMLLASANSTQIYLVKTTWKHIGVGVRKISNSHFL